MPSNIAKYRYMIPAAISISFVVLTYLLHYYYIFAVLLVANVLNIYWGEFSSSEIQQELNFYYSTYLARLLKYINAIVLLGVIVWATYYISRFEIQEWYFIGFVIAMGALTGCFALTLAHDLLHGHHNADKVFSTLLLLFAGIPYFATDHVCGHHRLIGLKNDATSAKLGDNFYQYFIRVSWQRLSHSYSNTYGLHSYMRKKIVATNILLALALLGIWGFIYLFSPAPATSIIFFIAQGFIAYTLYELINYIQHYGLSRRQYNNGSFEKIQMSHSWNCYYKYTNYILFLLPLHSIHHLHHADRKRISNFKGPRMPYLYFLMITMALLPPLWFKVMNPLVQQYQTDNT